MILPVLMRTTMHVTTIVVIAVTIEFDLKAGKNLRISVTIELTIPITAVDGVNIYFYMLANNVLAFMP